MVKNGGSFVGKMVKIKGTLGKEMVEFGGSFAKKQAFDAFFAVGCAILQVDFKNYTMLLIPLLLLSRI